jgi:hypothetical protein
MIAVPVRILGVVGLICSPALFAVYLMGGFDNPAPPRSAIIAQLLFLVGWLSSLVGLVSLSATGHGAGRYLLWAQVCGVALACTQELQDLLLPAPDHAALLYRLADAAWPLSVLFMIVVGIVVSRAGVLTGWRRFTPILCGVSLPLSLLSAVVAGRLAMGPVFGIATMGAWGALASALITAPQEPNLEDQRWQAKS